MVSTIIPFKDEEARLPETVRATLGFFVSLGEEFEIILVDDGSVDNSVFALGELLRDPHVKILRHENNIGKGAAIKTGVLESKGNVILFMDADMATPIGEFEKLHHAISNGADIAIGSRALALSKISKHQSFPRVLIGKLGNLLIRVLLGLPFKDTQCGFKLYRAPVAVDLFRDLQFPRWSFDYEILKRAKNRGYKVAEVPVAWSDKRGSKFRPIRDAARCFFDLLRMVVSGMK
jgi:glycosyltransferase involved in cell wall biosynthesis